MRSPQPPVQKPPKSSARPESRALRPRRKLAWFCSAPMAGFYSAVDRVFCYALAARITSTGPWLCSADISLQPLIWPPKRAASLIPTGSRQFASIDLAVFSAVKGNHFALNDAKFAAAFSTATPCAAIWPRGVWKSPSLLRHALPKRPGSPPPCGFLAHVSPLARPARPSRKRTARKPPPRTAIPPPPNARGPGRNKSWIGPT